MAVRSSLKLIVFKHSFWRNPNSELKLYSMLIISTTYMFFFVKLINRTNMTFYVLIIFFIYLLTDLIVKLRFFWT